MKRLGIDYGAKRVGVALSDDGGTMAFPRVVLPAGSSLINDIKKIVEKEKVQEVIIGESKDFSGKENPIMIEIHDMKGKLEKALNIPVLFEPELMTSMEADHIQGQSAMSDASAAAIILQSYINRHSNDN
jgi:putative Holliday junction resolvase